MFVCLLVRRWTRGRERCEARERRPRREERAERPDPLLRSSPFRGNLPCLL